MRQQPPRMPGWQKFTNGLHLGERPLSDLGDADAARVPRSRLNMKSCNKNDWREEIRVKVEAGRKRRRTRRSGGRKQEVEEESEMGQEEMV